MQFFPSSIFDCDFDIFFFLGISRHIVIQQNHRGVSFQRIRFFIFYWWWWFRLKCSWVNVYYFAWSISFLMGNNKFTTYIHSFQLQCVCIIKLLTCNLRQATVESMLIHNGQLWSIKKRHCLQFTIQFQLYSPCCDQFWFLSVWESSTLKRNS